MRLIQFCPPDNLSMLTQCFGHAARSPHISATVILLAPKDYFQDTQQSQAERANRLKKCKACTLLDVTNQTSKKCSIHGQGKSDQPQLEEVIEEMLNLHKPNLNQQSRPNAWLSSDIDIPDDFETSQAQSDIRHNGPAPNLMPMNKDDVEWPCVGSGLMLIDVNVADSTLKDSKDGNNGQLLAFQMQSVQANSIWKSRCGIHRICG